MTVADPVGFDEVLLCGNKVLFMRQAGLHTYHKKWWQWGSDWKWEKSCETLKKRSF